MSGVILQGKIGEWFPDDQAHPGGIAMFWAGRTATAFIRNDIQGQLHKDVTSRRVRDDMLPPVLQGNFVIQVDDSFSQFLGENFAMVMFADILFERTI